MRREVATWEDTDAERAVLSAVLLDPVHVWPRVSRLIADPEAAFSDPRHAAVWHAMARVMGSDTPLDLTTLADELRRARRFNTVGGAQFLAEITDVMPTTAHCEAHARIVTDLGAVRRFRESLRTALARVDAGGAATAVIDEVQRALHAARLGGAKRDAWRSIFDVATEAFEAFERVASGEAPGSVPTGIVALDGDPTTNATGLLAGLWRGELIVVAADQGGGKTAFAMRIARHVAGLGRRVCIVSVEMGAPELFWRLVCAEAGVESTKVRSGRVSQEEFNALTEAANVIAALPIVIRDAASSGRDVRNAVIDAHAEGPVDLVVVDYLQILDPPPGMSEADGAAVIDANARAMKLLAKEIPAPVVLLSQFNRTGQLANRKPRIQDLKGSGGIESHADAILVLHPTEGRVDGPPPPEMLVDLLVLKARAGATGEVRLRFVRKFTRFEEVVEHREGAVPDSAHGDDGDDMPVLEDPSFTGGPL